MASPSNPEPSVSLRRSDLVFALLLVLFGFLARWPFIVGSDRLIDNDEGIVGMMAQDIAEGRRFPIYFYGQRYMGALEAYVIAGFHAVTDDPLLALRLGPACFFALLVGVEYLFLARCLGRAAGLCGALALVATSPFFVYWSLAARGGYIEVLLAGTLLWWAYWEWFVFPGDRPPWKLATLGFLTGLGYWINPAIAVFVAPVVVHALLFGPVRLGRQTEKARNQLERIDRVTLGLPLALPALVLGAWFFATLLWSVEIRGPVAHHHVLFGLAPRVAQWIVLALVAMGVTAALVRLRGHLPRLREWCRLGAPFLLGFVIGMSPNIVYVLEKTLTHTAMDKSVPLGLHPIWSAGRPLAFLWHGLPLLLGADPFPLWEWVRYGRDDLVGIVPDEVGRELPRRYALNGIVLFGLLLASIAMLANHARSLGALLRLDPKRPRLGDFLLLAMAGMLVLYISNALAFDFTSIRYLVPLSAILPGLLGAALAGPRCRWMGLIGVWLAFFGWSLGQALVVMTVWGPHPLEDVAAKLRDEGVSYVTAEGDKAHLVSFLTKQRPVVAEFDPFWPRLDHLRRKLAPDEPAHYLAYPPHRDWMVEWRGSGIPGAPPPEVGRGLWRLLEPKRKEPGVEVVPLAHGFELWRLPEPLEEPRDREVEEGSERSKGPKGEKS
ncbi:hypothetical protein Pan216_06040 [Planctomycetes bacterium Pan216]|uniref:Glycosyltransferase RgtA/B/C/D-like domain-containing protein n=1 Tax=Kolteria novifilia TaxID=2527975 RepID=A0A518AYG9_9BACT|nr:hypothetical protein Pan216_06040 [Planctomycetes bacterium Pan216]